jgi:hypothetical protein
MRRDCWIVSVAAIGCGFALLPVAGNAQRLSNCPVVTEFPAHSLPIRSSTVRDLGGDLTHQTAPPLEGTGVQSGDAALAPARAFLYSALLPGASQWKMGQRRWMAYLILEGASWVAFGRAQSSALDLRDRYRTVAWDEARTFAGARVDGEFAYYEAMKTFERSGAFDLDSSVPGVQPQTDPSTFNGRTWALAMQIFFGTGSVPGPGDQEYADALRFYQDEGYDERFAWTWTDLPAEWEGYRGLIESSDDDFRRASQFAGVVTANHLLSGVDGFITARLRGATGDKSVAQLRLARDERTRGIGLVLQVRR